MAKPKYPAACSEKRPAVAILGFTDSRELAPFGDPRFEIWALNEMYRYFPNTLADVTAKGFTRWFEIHDRSMIDGDKQHIADLAKFPIPVYMQDVDPNIPPAVRFPKEEVEEASGTKYFTSSIAWMMGMALLEDFEEIHVYGVDMAQETEYFEQRPCCEYFAGLIQGKGKKLYVPPQSDLLKSVGQYGWIDRSSDFRLKLEERLEWLGNQKKAHQNNLAQLDQNRQVAISSINQLDGAIQDCTFWKRSWSTPQQGPGVEAHPERAVDPRVSVPAPSPDGHAPTNRLVKAGKE